MALAVGEGDERVAREVLAGTERLPVLAAPCGIEAILGDGVHVAVSGAVEHDLHLERRVAPACGDEGGVQRGAGSVEGVDANRNAVLLPLLVVVELGLGRR